MAPTIFLGVLPEDPRLAGLAEKLRFDAVDDLPWTESMSAHQNTLKDRGRIKTNSYHQVSEPVYLRSMNRWHHYRAQFEPYLAKIKPYADYFSYSLD